MEHSTASEAFRRLAQRVTIPVPRWPFLRLALRLTFVVLVLWGGSQIGPDVTSHSTRTGDTSDRTALHLRAEAHRGLPCSACHGESKDTVRLLFTGSIPERPAERPGSFDAQACERCHLGTEEDRRLLGELGGHRRHVLVEGLSCIQCHGGTTHAESVSPSVCVDCHEETPTHPSEVGTTPPCTSCHAMGARGATPESLDPDCARCHHQNANAFLSDDRPPITPDLIHGTLGTCGLCHDPHALAPGERTAPDECGQCHARPTRQREHIQESGVHQECSSCHAAHGPRRELSGLCGGCHQEQASSEQQTLGSVHQGCSDCHGDHRVFPSREECGRCHAQQTATLAAWNAQQHADCLSCHQPHASATASASCTECHGNQTRHGHQDCSTCHRPHEDAARAKACSECHDAVTQGSPGSPATESAAHSTCGDCHQPHAAGTAKARCGNCHDAEGQRMRVAAASEHRQCLSCHRQHEFEAGFSVCSTCHDPVELGDHTQGCQGCHQAHEASKPELPACSTCHADIKASGGQHRDCTSCHGVHRAPEGAPDCGSCHQSHAAGVNVWNPTPHRRCDGCHTTHSAEPPKTCRDCHLQQAQEIRQVGHECGFCHEPHAAPPGPRFAAPCASCHSGAASSVEGRGPTHADCQQCHQSHEAGVKGCSDCHEQPRGAHGFSGHQQCATCHDRHAPLHETRQTCLGCHQDRRAHEPKAPRCSSCHPFE